jgi:hypothetical protein
VKTLLLVISDRPRLLERTLLSAAQHLPAFHHLVHVDDQEHQLGFAGAIQHGWQQVLATDADYVVHVEADFLFRERVDVAGMVQVLEEQPYLAQIVLKRQPWNPDELRAGGIIEQNPSDFAQRSNGIHVWTEHRRFFSTNPCVYRASLCERGWPQVPQSEGIFTHQLLEDPYLHFAFWGAKLDPPRVEHIGHERAGHGY